MINRITSINRLITPHTETINRIIITAMITVRDAEKNTNRFCSQSTSPITKANPRAMANGFPPEMVNVDGRVYESPIVELIDWVWAWIVAMESRTG